MAEDLASQSPVMPSSSRTTTVCGVGTSYSIGEWQALGYNTAQEPVGSYLFRPSRGRVKANGIRTIVVRGAECPYCHGSLGRLDPRDGSIMGRMLSANRHGDVMRVVVEPVPVGVVVARCMACRSTFSVLAHDDEVGTVDARSQP